MKIITENVKGICLDILGIFLPPLCIGCDAVLDSRSKIGLCPKCYGELNFWHMGSVSKDVPEVPNLPAGIKSFRAPFLYKNMVAKLIQDFKFKDKTEYAEPLSRYLKPYVGQIMAENKNAQWVLVPVPMHKKRLLKRFFNQSAMLTNYLAKSTNVAKNLYDLKRVKATEPQVGKTALQRKNNLRGAFEASKFFVNKHIILIDDVWTTGSTAAHCANALLKAGANEVHVLTIAYVDPNSNEQ